jgi:hypothetical protein
MKDNYVNLVDKGTLIMLLERVGKFIDKGVEDLLDNVDDIRQYELWEVCDIIFEYYIDTGDIGQLAKDLFVIKDNHVFFSDSVYNAYIEPELRKYFDDGRTLSTTKIKELLRHGYGFNEYYVDKTYEDLKQTIYFMWSWYLDTALTRDTMASKLIKAMADMENTAESV